MKALRIAINIFILTFCAGVAAAEYPPPDHPAKNTANYTCPPTAPLEERIYPATDFVMDYFAAFDRELIPEDKPYTPYTPTAEERASLDATFAALPDKVREVVTPHLLGIYFIENMIGSGWTEWISGPEGDYYIVALNADVLHKNASDWISGKEKSVYIQNREGYDVRIDIGEDLTGGYYILLHEIGHVYDYIMQVTPGEPGLPPAMDFELLRVTQPVAIKKYRYMRKFWLKFRAPDPDYDFMERENVTFYGLFGGPKINISKAMAIYQELEKSPFITLYAAQNWMEDFAELFAAYVSTRIMKRPWTLKVTKDGNVIYEMDDVLERPSLKNRVALLEKIIQ